MRVLVCGGRNFTDSDFLFAEMDKTHAATPITWKAGVLVVGVRAP